MTVSRLHVQQNSPAGTGATRYQPHRMAVMSALKRTSGVNSVMRKVSPDLNAAMIRAALLACLVAAIATVPLPALAKSYILYAGSYTTETSKGIYAWRFNDEDGSLSSLGLAAEVTQPAHLWVAPNGRFLYAVNWEPEGGVSAFRVDSRSGKLTLLNKVSSQGALPNQVVLDPSGHIAIAVNYMSGTLAAYKVMDDGRLSEAFYVDKHTGTPLSPQQPYAKIHGVEFTKDSRYMYVTDLGLDRVYAYKVDIANSTITPANLAYVNVHAGAGPRRLQLSPNDRFLYVCHETDSKVSVFAVNGTEMKEIQMISTLPPGATTKNTTAEIMIDRAGRHLYVSNRGHDSIAVFDIDPASGRLKLVANTLAGGRTPRNIRLDPSGRYLFSANEDGGTITELKVDPQTGLLSTTSVSVSINHPGGLYFAPSN